MPDPKISGQPFTGFEVPFGVIIFRPVNTVPEAIQNLFMTHPESDLVCIDFLFVPGGYGLMSSFLKTSGFRRACWQRRDTYRVHEIDLDKLPWTSPHQPVSAT